MDLDAVESLLTTPDDKEAAVGLRENVTTRAAASMRSAKEEELAAAVRTGAEVGGPRLPSWSKPYTQPAHTDQSNQEHGAVASIPTRGRRRRGGCCAWLGNKLNPPSWYAKNRAAEVALRAEWVAGQTLRDRIAALWAWAVARDKIKGGGWWGFGEGDEQARHAQEKGRMFQDTPVVHNGRRGVVTVVYGKPPWHDISIMWNDDPSSWSHHIKNAECEVADVAAERRLLVLLGVTGTHRRVTASEHSFAIACVSDVQNGALAQFEPAWQEYLVQAQTTAVWRWVTDAKGCPHLTPKQLQRLAEALHFSYEYLCSMFGAATLAQSRFQRRKLAVLKGRPNTAAGWTRRPRTRGRVVTTTFGSNAFSNSGA